MVQMLEELSAIDIIVQGLAKSQVSVKICYSMGSSNTDCFMEQLRITKCLKQLSYSAMAPGRDTALISSCVHSIEVSFLDQTCTTR